MKNLYFILFFLFLIFKSPVYAQFGVKNEASLSTAYITPLTSQNSDANMIDLFEDITAESNALALQVNYRRNFFSFIYLGIYGSYTSYNNNINYSVNGVSNEPNEVLETFVDEPINYENSYNLMQSIDINAEEIRTGISLQLNAFPYAKVQPFVGVYIGGLISPQVKRISSQTTVSYQNINQTNVNLYNNQPDVVSAQRVKEDLNLPNSWQTTSAFSIGVDFKITRKIRLKPQLVMNNVNKNSISYMYDQLLLNQTKIVLAEKNEQSLIRFMPAVELAIKF